MKDARRDDVTPSARRTLRVLHVVASTQRRGGEMFAADLVGALRRDAIDQRVAVLHGGGASTAPFDAPVTLLRDGDAIRGPIALATTAVRLRRLVARWSPDVVQAHGGEALKLSVAATIGSHAHVVYRRIGSAHPWVSSGLRRSLYGWLMRRANMVIAVSEAVRAETGRVFSIRPERIVAIPNAVAVERLLPTRPPQDVRAELGIPVDAPVVLSLGAFTWEKDPLAQLRAADAVLAERMDSYFVMAGDGPLRATLATETGRVRTADRIRLVGATANVADLLAASDVMLLASRTEGMPGALIEAGMAGVPVVAYAVGGVPELVRDGATGLLVERGDVDGLARCVLKLLDDESERAAMGERARVHCRANFEIGAVAPRYAKLYRGLA
jgi:glycosyltransferase involved in cell wall biosynthesis